MAVGDIGSYEGYGFRLGQSSGVMAAGLAANSPVFSFRNPTPAAGSAGSRRLRILQVTVNAAVGATGFTAGAGQFAMLVARNFTAADTGGSDITPAANSLSNALRTKQNPSILAGSTGSIRIASTAALTAGTRTLDSNPVGNINFGAPATAGSLMVADIPIYNDWTSIYGIPLVLAGQEGFVIQASVPAVGVWQFGVNVLWAELDGGQLG